MADGQSWNLPLPMLVLTPADTSAGFVTALSLDGSDDYQALVKVYEAAENGLAMIGALFGMGKALLLHNYDLSFDQIKTILRFGVDDTYPDGVRIKDEVMAVATGDGPKPSGDGDGSAPSPAE